MKDKELIIEKIKKLISLSECPSTSEHERSSARQRAQKLMLKYSVDSLIDDSQPEILQDYRFKLDKPIFSLDGIKLHQILQAIGPSFGCYSYFKRAEPKVAYLMGFKINCEIVDYTARVLINQGRQDCLSGWEQNPSAGFKISFWLGFIEGLKLRYQNLTKEETGLVVYDRVRETYWSRIRTTAITNYGNLVNAKEAGSKSAQEARVSPGLENTSRGNLLK